MVLPRPVPIPPPFEIVTGARLHLGLLDTRDPFGGVGLMLAQPATRIRVRAADQFEALGPARERVEAVATRFASHWQLAEPPRCAIEVVERPQPHAGLGSGTQLAMAVAEALCHFTGRRVADWHGEGPAADGHSGDRGSVDRCTLAVDIAGRGRRSAVGAHGYFEGGLIFESAGADARGLNPIRARMELPESWRVLLVRPPNATPKVAGETELAHFARLPPATRSDRERLTREVEDELLPAAAQGDFERWSEAVYHYNRESGKLFAAVQGGPYNGEAIEGCVEELRRLGVSGVGQSSWGPTVFAFCESQQQATQIRSHTSDLSEVTIASLTNRGRTLG